MAITTAKTAILFLPFLKSTASSGATSFFSSILMMWANRASITRIPVMSTANKVEAKSCTEEAWASDSAGLGSSVLFRRYGTTATNRRRTTFRKLKGLRLHWKDRHVPGVD